MLIDYKEYGSFICQCFSCTGTQERVFLLSFDPDVMIFSSFFFVFLSFPFKASWYSIRFLMTGFLNKITFIKTSSIQLLWFLDIKFESRTVAPITYAIYFFLFFPLFSFFLFTKFFFRFSLDLLFSGFLTYLILKLQNTKLVEQGNLILTGL